MLALTSVPANFIHISSNKALLTDQNKHTKRGHSNIHAFLPSVCSSTKNNRTMPRYRAYSLPTKILYRDLTSSISFHRVK